MSRKHATHACHTYASYTHVNHSHTHHTHTLTIASETSTHTYAHKKKSSSEFLPFDKYCTSYSFEKEVEDRSLTPRAESMRRRLRRRGRLTSTPVRSRSTSVNIPATVLASTSSRACGGALVFIGQTDTVKTRPSPTAPHASHDMEGGSGSSKKPRCVQDCVVFFWWRRRLISVDSSPFFSRVVSCGCRKVD